LEGYSLFENGKLYSIYASDFENRFAK